jgi:predicted DNA-binding transcriptional regulator AlpA
MHIPPSQVSPHVKKSGGKKTKIPATPATTTTHPQRQGDADAERMLRFNDLKRRKIVTNWPTLLRWIECEGFPPGIQLAVHTRAWFESDVEAWLRSRPTWTPDENAPS